MFEKVKAESFVFFSQVCYSNKVKLMICFDLSLILPISESIAMILFWEQKF